jgi:predicted DNA-binding transcriptional regulator AlpA
MAEARADQASFGWAVEAAAPGAEDAVARRARRRGPPSQAPRRDSQRIGASAGESPLPPDNELWDVHSAARFLKRSASWVYHKAEDGTLPVKRIGGWGIRFIPGELRAWVESGGASTHAK